MKSNYSKLGEYIKEINTRNSDLSVKKLIGVSMEKTFISSVANVVGTDMSVYKILKKGQFACKLMSVGRDEKLPVDLYKEKEDAIVSSAYYVFETVDENILSSEYLFMWLCRPENDRYIGYISGGDVRGGISWETFCETPIRMPSINKQREIVKEYNVILNRIAYNLQLIQKLEETTLAIYKQWFVDFEFPDVNGKPYKSNGGEMVESELGEIPKGWEVKTIDKIGKVVDSLHKTPEYSSTGLPMIRVTDISPGFLNLSKAMLVDEIVFNEFSKNHKSSKGDIIVSRVGATFGEFSYAYTNEKFCLGQNTAVIIPKSLESSLLFTALSSPEIKEQINQKVVGSAYSTLSLKDIRNLKIILPESKLNNTFLEVSNKFNVLFEYQGFCHQELSALTKIKSLLLSKLATVED